MILFPNAKINIGLNVIKKRLDGFHDISSFFYPVKHLYDILEVIPSSNYNFSTSGIQINDNNNICTKAFNILKQDFDLTNVSIHLHKQIPIGAGLGGGSADGAFTLKALNTLFDLKLSACQLQEYALKLGADCPFFINNNASYVYGIGDKMSKIDLDLSEFNFKFIFPKLQISTSEAYSSITPMQPKTNLLELINIPICDWKGKIKNDFELDAFKKYSQLQEYKQKFYSEGAIYSSMSGSGSVIYGIFKR